jgi:hypothetical protein
MYSRNEDGLGGVAHFPWKQTSKAAFYLSSFVPEAVVACYSITIIELR